MLNTILSLLGSVGVPLLGQLFSSKREAQYTPSDIRKWMEELGLPSGDEWKKEAMKYLDIYGRGTQEMAANQALPKSMGMHAARPELASYQALIPAQLERNKTMVDILSAADNINRQNVGVVSNLLNNRQYFGSSPRDDFFGALGMGTQLYPSLYQLLSQINPSSPSTSQRIFGQLGTFGQNPFLGQNPFANWMRNNPLTIR